MAHVIGDQSQLGRIRDQLRTAGRSLTVTDCVMVGKLQPSFFPKVFDGMEICHWMQRCGRVPVSW